MALSADGATALIGSPDATVGNTGSAGRAYAYTSLPQTPRVLAAPASSIAVTSGTLNAKVNPNGYKVSKCEFEYGTSLAYEHSVPCKSLPGAGESLGRGVGPRLRAERRNDLSLPGRGDQLDRYQRWRRRNLPNAPAWSLPSPGREAQRSCRKAPSTGRSARTGWKEKRRRPTRRSARPRRSHPSARRAKANDPADACYDSDNDVSGLSTQALRLDNANDYVIAGDRISIGSGEPTASPASGPVGPAGDVIGVPLELSASQTWNVSGRGSISEEAGLLLAKDVEGAGSTLEIGLSDEPVVYLAENDIEVGSLSITGADAGEPGVLNGVVGLLGGRLNASDGQPVQPQPHISVWQRCRGQADYGWRRSSMSAIPPTGSKQRARRSTRRVASNSTSSARARPPKRNTPSSSPKASIALAGANLGVVRPGLQRPVHPAQPSSVDTPTRSSRRPVRPGPVLQRASRRSGIANRVRGSLCREVADDADRLPRERCGSDGHRDGGRRGGGRPKQKRRRNSGPKKKL